MSFIVKNTTFPSLLDLIAPHSCRGCGHLGEALCNRCKNNIIVESINYCPNCKSPSPNGRCAKCKSLPPTFVISNRSGIMDELIHDFKYHSSRAIARPLAEIIHNILPTVSEPVNIIPLPTIHHHIRERGLDHTLLIAKYLAKLRGKNYRVEKLLLRTKNTVQVGSDRKTRILQAQDAYTINPDIKINPNTTYILFDDVWTTGASMKSAVKLLKKAGAKKIIISLLAVSV